MKKFWMVYVQGKPGPTFHHDDFEKAHNEMKRLARAESGRKVWVLETVSSAIHNDLVIEGDEPIPF